MQPLPYAFSVNHAIIAFPLIQGHPRKGTEDLRLPINTDKLHLGGDYHVAMDLLNSYPYDLFLTTDRGQITENDKRELKGKISSFLPVV